MNTGSQYVGDPTDCRERAMRESGGICVESSSKLRRSTEIQLRGICVAPECACSSKPDPYNT